MSVNCKLLVQFSSFLLHFPVGVKSVEGPAQVWVVMTDVKNSRLIPILLMSGRQVSGAGCYGQERGERKKVL